MVPVSARIAQRPRSPTTSALASGFSIKERGHNFVRLRDYVIAAGEEGIYVAVMLFEGFGLHLSMAPDNVEGHPFHAANNVNGVSIASINDYQVLPLDPRVQALQEAYIRKVVDIVHDLPGVLYEVANESSGGGFIEERSSPSMVALCQARSDARGAVSTTARRSLRASPARKRYGASRGASPMPSSGA